MNKTKKRNGFLDFLKLIFAIIIVIGHGDKIYGTLPPNRIMLLASFGVVLLCGLAIIYISKLYSYIWDRNKNKIKKMLVAS